MSRFISIAVLCLSGAFAQTPAAFDVASIHPSKLSGEGSKRQNIQANPGTLSMRNVSLKMALKWAYGVMEYQVTGPDWIGFERYDISAKAAGQTSEAEMRKMLQTLLSERFKLTLHRQTKELPAYLLVVAKGGIKFHESQITEGEPVLNADKGRLTVEVNGVTAEQFVDMLSNILRAPVINNTGLTGRYDGKVNVAKYIPDGSAGGPPPDPIAIIMAGLQEELGLKLESKKLPLDLLIVDHAEKVPAEN
jgi:uncharacterized protein (TIGR03435 family)